MKEVEAAVQDEPMGEESQATTTGNPLLPLASHSVQMLVMSLWRRVAVERAG